MIGRVSRQWAAVVAVAIASVGPAIADAQEDGRRTGKMISVKGVIDSGLKNRVISAARTAVREGVEVLLFDLQPTSSDFGPCYDLARAIAELGGNVRRTVAYVNGKLTGHAVLVALACDEIVMSDTAKIGEVYSDAAATGTLVEENAYSEIARRKGHGNWIPLGMIDRDLALLEISTPNGKQFVPQSELEAVKKTTQVLGQTLVKQAGELLLLDAATAKRYGLVRRTAENRRQLAAAYGLPESITAQDELLDEANRPVLLKLEGAIDSRMYQYVLRRIKQAMTSGSNLVFIEVESTHGDQAEASNIASALRAWPAHKVGWVTRQATGPSVMLLFACDEVVVGPDALLGDFRLEGATEGEYRNLADSAVDLARGSRLPESVVRGLIDPRTTVFQVRNKENPAVVSYKTVEELEEPTIAKLWEKAAPGPIKGKGVYWKLAAAEAMQCDFAVALAATEGELKSLYDVNVRLAVLQPGWVDAMIDGLTSTTGTVFLLVLGMTCLYIEFQIPGFGVAGIISAFCFVLFFWSRYLSGMANSLEIVMFLMGTILLAIELFVLPGFGVTGVMGILMILASLVLASQSFTIPQSPEEVRRLVTNMATLSAALVVTIALAVAIARNFPSIPLFNRMMLSPPDAVAEVAEPSRDSFDGENPLRELLGQRGIVSSPLRPSGRVRIGGKYYDVLAQGAFLDAGAEVEVIEVYQNRIVVREHRHA